MATAAGGSNGLTSFLREGVSALTTPRLILPVLLLTLVLTGSNMAILTHAPAPGAQPGIVFAAAAAVRLIGLMVLAVAILRIANPGGRRPYMPDAGFWIYLLTFLLSLGASILARRILGAGETVAGFLLTNAAATLLLSPLAAWFVALAVVKPVPWSPARWVRALPAWLPHFLFWSLLLVTPMAGLHAAIDLRLLAGAGNGFWPLATFDGVLSAVMVLIGLALGSAAYRRVARS